MIWKVFQLDADAFARVDGPLNSLVVGLHRKGDQHLVDRLAGQQMLEVLKATDDLPPDFGGMSSTLLESTKPRTTQS